MTQSTDMSGYRLLAELAEDWGWDDLSAVVFPGHLPDRIVLAALNAHARIVWLDPLHTYIFGRPEHLYLRFVPCPDSARCGCGTNHPEAIDTSTPHPVTFIDFT
ncbi:hypothetical protein [Streptomyces albus]|uniref:hypothetical protein n=1 Tax=Streptomyces albus TaxID=1888 RepID=UPI0006E21881|nr:hypothetical protein [Streptomyces albus]